MPPFTYKIVKDEMVPSDTDPRQSLRRVEVRFTSQEAFIPGKLPDAWMVEVKDIAKGFSGYLTSLRQDITAKPTKERYSRGWRSRNWEPKLGPKKK